LIGAQAIFLIQNRKTLGQRAGRMLVNIMIIIVLNLAISLTPGIDLWGHLGGLVTGVIFAWLAGPKLEFERGVDSIVIADQRSEFNYIRVIIMMFIAISGMAAIKFFIQ